MHRRLSTFLALCCGVVLLLTAGHARAVADDVTADDSVRTPGSVESRPLGTPAGKPARLSRTNETSQAVRGGDWLRTGASLAIVFVLLGAMFVGLRYLARRGVIPGVVTGGRGPSGVLEVLGRYPAGGGATLLVLKFDRRVLLCSQSSGRGVLRSGSTLNLICELSEPEDVASILLKMRGDEETALAKKFEGLLAQEEERTAAVLEESSTARTQPRQARPRAVTPPVVQTRRVAASLCDKLARLREAELAGRPLTTRKERA